MIDPRIQYYFWLDKRRLKKYPKKHKSKKYSKVQIPSKISIIAKISDETKFRELKAKISKWNCSKSSLEKIFNSIGQTEDGHYIVTAIIPLDRAQVLRKLPYVISLKAARTLKPFSNPVINKGLGNNFLPSSVQTQTGKGVIIGIIDTGCDFVHQNFRKNDGSTRILALWDQRNGQIYKEADINRALGSIDPYKELGYKPQGGSHGTHIMDIACGNGLGTKFQGIAPEASIIFVESSPSDIPRSGVAVIGDNNTEGSSFYGDSANLLNATKFIFEEANTIPCVVNISLGTAGGPHDGSSLVEQGLDSFIAQISNRAVVVAAGNWYENGIHTSGLVPTGEYIDLIWQNNRSSEEEIEIWYSGKDEFKLEILDDRDNSYGDISLGTGPKSFFSETIVAIHRKHDPNNFDNNINIYLKKTSLRKIKFRLHGITITDGKFHAWIEKNSPSSSSRFSNLDNKCTLGSIACSKKSIVVGAYDANSSEQELLGISSAGPTRDGREKPEISAPGIIRAASSLSSTKTIEWSGTSMATAVVTGAIALILAEARNAGKDLTIDQIRKILINTAHFPGTGATGWDGRYGMGKINLVGAIEAIRQL